MRGARKAPASAPSTMLRVAALVLLAEAAAGNILIVDLDVHQGDGTADILGDERRVFTFSMHGDRNYPMRKIASDLDIALPDGTGDAAYLERLGGILPELTAWRAGTWFSTMPGSIACRGPARQVVAVERRAACSATTW